MKLFRTYIFISPSSLKDNEDLEGAEARVGDKGEQEEASGLPESSWG